MVEQERDTIVDGLSFDNVVVVEGKREVMRYGADLIEQSSQ